MYKLLQSTAVCLFVNHKESLKRADRKKDLLESILSLRMCVSPLDTRSILYRDSGKTLSSGTPSCG